MITIDKEYFNKILFMMCIDCNKVHSYCNNCNDFKLSKFYYYNIMMTKRVILQISLTIIFKNHGILL